MLSREVIAEGTMRESSSNTLLIRCCSWRSSAPACAPASAMATMSSGVMSSVRLLGTLNQRNSRSASPLNTHTSGAKAHMHSCIGRTTLTAMRSGCTIARRLGIRSAKSTNSEVTNTKDSTKLSVPSKGPSYTGRRRSATCGDKACSPTIPPRMATALSPICTTVKKLPGLSCSASTRWALV